MRFILSLLLIFGFINLVQAETLTIKVEQIVSVYDGDTFKIDIPEEFCTIDILCKNLPVRVIGIDAPEIKSKCYDEHTKAILAKKALSNALKKGNLIHLLNIKRDSRFRIDAIVIADQTNVADEMLGSGLVRPYDGKTKRLGWCE